MRFESFPTTHSESREGRKRQKKESNAQQESKMERKKKLDATAILLAASVFSTPFVHADDVLNGQDIQYDANENEIVLHEHSESALEGMTAREKSLRQFIEETLKETNASQEEREAEEMRIQKIIEKAQNSAAKVAGPAADHIVDAVSKKAGFGTMEYNMLKFVQGVAGALKKDGEPNDNSLTIDTFEDDSENEGFTAEHAKVAFTAALQTYVAEKAAQYLEERANEGYDSNDFDHQDGRTPSSFDDLMNSSLFDIVNLKLGEGHLKVSANPSHIDNHGAFVGASYEVRF